MPSQFVPTAGTAVELTEKSDGAAILSELCGIALKMLRIFKTRDFLTWNVNVHGVKKFPCYTERNRHNYEIKTLRFFPRIARRRI